MALSRDEKHSTSPSISPSPLNSGTSAKSNQFTPEEGDLERKCFKMVNENPIFFKLLAFEKSINLFSQYEPLDRIDMIIKSMEVMSEIGVSKDKENAMINICLALSLVDTAKVDSLENGSTLSESISIGLEIWRDGLQSPDNNTAHKRAVQPSKDVEEKKTEDKLTLADAIAESRKSIGLDKAGLFKQSADDSSVEKKEEQRSSKKLGSPS